MSTIALASVMSLSIARASERGDGKRERAAKAYSDAERAALAGDFARAAQLFELADSVIPTPQALRSAARARMAAGHNLPALALAEAMLARYPRDPRSRALASELRDLLRPRYVRLAIRCSAPCGIRIDGYLAERDRRTEHLLYAEPGEHQLVALFADGSTRERRVRAGAGETASLALEHAASSPSAARTATEGARIPGGPMTSSAASRSRQRSRSPARPGPRTAHASATKQASRDDNQRLPNALLAIGGVATAALGVSALWSGRDTLRAHQDYQANPTLAGYHDGQRRERRTNLLLGATALSAGITVAVTILRASHARDERPKRRLGLGPIGDGYGVSAAGAF